MLNKIKSDLNKPKKTESGGSPNKLNHVRCGYPQHVLCLMGPFKSLMAERKLAPSLEFTSKYLGLDTEVAL